MAEKAIRDLPYHQFCRADDDVHAMRYHWNPRQANGWVCRDHHVVSLVESGCAVISTKGQSYRCEAGMCYVVPGTLSHSVEADGPEGVLESILLIRASFIESFVSFIGQVPSCLAASAELTPRLFNLTDAKQELFSELINGLIVDRPSRVDSCAALCLVCGLQQEEQDSPYKDLPPWLRQALIKLRRPQNLKRGPRALAELCGKSLDHVGRVIKQHRNMTASQLVNELRIEVACAHLRMSDRPILHIAEEVGFNDASHFYRVFKRLRSCSPLHWRKRHR